MKDCIGNDLNIEDKVYILDCGKTSSELSFGEVIGFTKCKVRVKVLIKSRLSYYDVTLRYPHKLAKVFVNKD